MPQLRRYVKRKIWGAGYGKLAEYEHRFRKNYVGYIANRPQSHGLFFDGDEPLLLTETAREVSEHSGDAIENRLQRGSLKIIKTFEGRETPIAGVPFTITGTTTVGTEVAYEAETDENGEIFLENLLVGEYTVKETDSELTAGYVLSPEQNATVAADEIAVMTIENKLIRGSVRFVKTDGADSATLSGAVFDLRDPDGNTLGGYTTDENGEILIEGLPYGFGYKFIETQAPDGYTLGDDEITFDITENGETVEIAAANDKIPVTPGNPKTGYNGHIGLWYALTAASAAGLAALTVCGIRKRGSRKQKEQ